eukprot:6176170-Pleurochrysis_carterae.AAC.1
MCARVRACARTSPFVTLCACGLSRRYSQIPSYPLPLHRSTALATQARQPTFASQQPLLASHGQCMRVCAYLCV